MEHEECGHGCRDRLSNYIKDKYYNLTIEMINAYLDLCEFCVLKRYSKGKGLVVKPIISTYFNEHVQTDLVDMQGQECQDFRFFLVYQDHFTKFTLIRPLKRKTAKATNAIIFDFFCTLGPPDILQTDNGKEFKNSLLKRVSVVMGVTMRHARPRNSQANGGVERANQDIEKMLVTWKSNNPDLSWVTGLHFVQMYKNRSLCVPVQMSPFEATFGVKMIQGLQDSIVPQELFETTTNEEDLRELGLISADDVVSFYSINKYQLNYFAIFNF